VLYVCCRANLYEGHRKEKILRVKNKLRRSDF
jgi:hypothetical protein